MLTYNALDATQEGYDFPIDLDSEPESRVEASLAIVQQSLALQKSAEKPAKRQKLGGEEGGASEPAGANLGSKIDLQPSRLSTEQAGGSPKTATPEKTPKKSSRPATPIGSAAQRVIQKRLQMTDGAQDLGSPEKAHPGEAMGGGNGAASGASGPGEAGRKAGQVPGAGTAANNLLVVRQPGWRKRGGRKAVPSSPNRQALPKAAVQKVAEPPVEAAAIELASSNPDSHPKSSVKSTPQPPSPERSAAQPLAPPSNAVALSPELPAAANVDGYVEVQVQALRPCMDPSPQTSGKALGETSFFVKLNSYLNHVLWIL